MKEINIGRVLIKNRHKRGITQDELANHLGVSKGAVSKSPQAFLHVPPFPFSPAPTLCIF